VLLPKIKKIPKNTNGRLAIPAPAGLLVFFGLALGERNFVPMELSFRGTFIPRKGILQEVLLQSSKTT